MLFVIGAGCQRAPNFRAARARRIGDVMCHGWMVRMPNTYATSKRIPPRPFAHRTYPLTPFTLRTLTLGERFIPNLFPNLLS